MCNVKENVSNSTYKKESKTITHRLSKSNEKLPQESAQNRQPQQQMSMYNEEHQLSSMDLNEEQYQIEEEYGDDLYSDQSYMNQQHGEGIGQQGNIKNMHNK